MDHYDSNHCCLCQEPFSTSKQPIQQVLSKGLATLKAKCKEYGMVDLFNYLNDREGIHIKFTLSFQNFPLVYDISPHFLCYNYETPVYLLRKRRDVEYS